MTTFEIIIIPIIFFEEFVKRSLIGVYYMWQKYDYWSHNKAVAKAAKEAEENPPILPTSPFNND